MIDIYGSWLIRVSEEFPGLKVVIDKNSKSHSIREYDLFDNEELEVTGIRLEDNYAEFNTLINSTGWKTRTVISIDKNNNISSCFYHQEHCYAVKISNTEKNDITGLWKPDEDSQIDRWEFSIKLDLKEKLNVECQDAIDGEILDISKVLYKNNIINMEINEEGANRNVNLKMYNFSKNTAEFDYVICQQTQISKL